MRLLFLCAAALLSTPTHAATLNAAVAANFRDTFEVLRERFTQATGIEVNASYGASGMLYTQIRSGAPFAVFYCADVERPALLESAGIAQPGSRFVYAAGSLSLWVPGSTQPDQHWLLDDGHRFTIANPEIAPYGRAAMQVLDQLQATPVTPGRIIIGNSVAQTMHFIATGAVPGGLVARAQLIALGVPATEIWQVPATMYAPIEQAAVAIKGGDEAAARSLLDFTRSTDSRALIVSHGYSVTP